MTRPYPKKRRFGQISAEKLAVAEALRVDDAAALIGLSRSSIYNLINAGELPSTIVAGRRLIRRDDLRRLIHIPAKTIA
jgi:excisionase family DNA binding protein